MPYPDEREDPEPETVSFGTGSGRGRLSRWINRLSLRQQSILLVGSTALLAVVVLITVVDSDRSPSERSAERSAPPTSGPDAAAVGTRPTEQAHGPYVWVGYRGLMVSMPRAWAASDTRSCDIAYHGAAPSMGPGPLRDRSCFCRERRLAHPNAFGRSFNGTRTAETRSTLRPARCGAWVPAGRRLSAGGLSNTIVVITSESRPRAGATRGVGQNRYAGPGHGTAPLGHRPESCYPPAAGRWDSFQGSITEQRSGAPARDRGRGPEPNGGTGGQHLVSTSSPSRSCPRTDPSSRPTEPHAASVGSTRDDHHQQSDARRVCTPPLGDVDDLRAFLAAHPRMMVLTGAGCSTESGHPRLPRRRRVVEAPATGRVPAVHARPAVRQRYWARSLIGWRSFGRAEPNAAHHALARLEQRGADRPARHPERRRPSPGGRVAAGDRPARPARPRRLHVAAGTAGPRRPGSTIWKTLNPLGRARRADRTRRRRRPGRTDFSAFVVPDCPRCGGIVKPDVVFFGENVPPGGIPRRWRRSAAPTRCSSSARR